jgi:predicted NAD/FAD-dependent oxidoreductase
MLLCAAVIGRSINFGKIVTPSSATEGSRSQLRCFASSPKIETVAVIGGGISGLACAQRLAEKYDVTVYDAGRRQPGGRCSSRFMIDPSPKSRSVHEVMSTLSYLQRRSGNGILSKYTYDHAAQILTVPNHPRYRHFRRQVEEWEYQGIIRRFPNDSLYNLLSFRKMEPIRDLQYYFGGWNDPKGVSGMCSIPSFMVHGSSFQLKQDVFVYPQNGVEHMINQNKWKVQGLRFGTPCVLGMYDAIVIAHSGEDANRLMSFTPATELCQISAVQSQYKVPKCGGPCLTLNSIYSLSFAIPARGSILSQKLPQTFLSGFVHSHPALRFLSCQTRKYMYTKDNTLIDDDVEVWTVLSSGAFAKKYTVDSDKYSPKRIAKIVSRWLLLALEECLTGIQLTSNRLNDDEESGDEGVLRIEEPPLPACALELSVLDQHLQLWGSGIPMNVWDRERGRTPAGFLYDGKYRVGMCGDWLVEASIAGAWTSGRFLAEHMLQCSTKSYGFKGSFRRSVMTAKAGFGMLPFQ